MHELRKDKKALKLFFGLVIPMSIVLEGAYIACPNSLIMLVLMWTPGIAGIITNGIYFKKENALGMRLCSIRYILPGILIPIIYLTLSYGLAWCILGDSTIGIKQLALTMGYQTESGIIPICYVIVYLVVGLFASCLSAAGEELGWRGFMYPVMERVIGRKKALIFSGIIWAGWHMPLMIAGLYQAKTVLAYGLVMFAVEVVLLSVIMSWLRGASNSIIPALLVHASHNLLDQEVFQTMSTNEYVSYYAGEQGFITIILLAVIAGIVMCYWKREESLKL